MERGALPVCASTNDGYLWETFILSTSHWDRICNLRPTPVSHLWTMKSTILLRSRGCEDASLTADDPDAIAALVQIEYLWTDLDAVEDFCRKSFFDVGCSKKSIGWIIDEVSQRRQWATGLRRAWLVSVQ